MGTMGTLQIVLIAAGAVVLLILFWFIGKSNSFKRLRNKLTESQSGIEVALTKRYDMLTKLFDVAKGYMNFERDTMTQVINLRKGMSMSEMKDASAKMDDMQRSINVVAENYPQLRSSDVVVNLQAGVRDAEEHLQAARRLFNSNATMYNNAIQVFPGSIVAGMKGLKSSEYFEAEEAKKQDVSMKF